MRQRNDNNKVEKLEYEFIRDASTDEICVTLTKQQATFLYSITNVFNWRTRWYSPTGAAVDMDTMQSMIADANSRLQTGLEGECINMAVTDVDLVTDPCTLVISYSNGTTKTIPLTEPCFGGGGGIETNYVKTIFPSCEGGQIAYLEYDASLEIDVTKFVNISECLPEPPTPIENYVKSIHPDCVGGQIAYTQWDESLGFDVTKFVDITDCLPEPPEPPTPPAIGGQIGLSYYSPEIRCKVAQFMADRWREGMDEVIDHAILVGAVDVAQFMFMGAYMPIHNIHVASELVRNTTVGNLTPISVWLSSIRADSTLTCIFYDNLPPNLRVPADFSVNVANAIQTYMPSGGSFTTDQINIVQGYVRFWGVHQWQNIITEALWHPNYTPTYCDVCAPEDPGTRWAGHINFANNDGDPPYTVNGATYTIGSGLAQTSQANPIIIGYNSAMPLDQACIRVSLAPGDRVTLRIVDILTDVTLAETTEIWNIGDPQVQLTWDGETDPAFSLAEQGVYFYAEFDDLGSPSIQYVTRAGVRGWGTFTPVGFVSGSVC